MKWLFCPCFVLFLLACSTLSGQVLPTQSITIETEGIGYALPNYFRVEVTTTATGKDFQEAYKNALAKIEALNKEMNQGTTTSFSVNPGWPMVWKGRGLRQTGTLPEVMVSFNFPIGRDALANRLLLLAADPQFTVLRLVPSTDGSQAESQAMQQALQRAQLQVSAFGVPSSGSGSLVLKTMEASPCLTDYYDPIWSLTDAHLQPSELPLEHHDFPERGEILPGMLSVRCRVKTLWGPPGKGE